jgi:hypothetical protein
VSESWQAQTLQPRMEIHRCHLEEKPFEEKPLEVKPFEGAQFVCGSNLEQTIRMYRSQQTPLKNHSALVSAKQDRTIWPNIVIWIPAMLVGTLAGLLLTTVLLGVSLYESTTLCLRSVVKCR